MADTRSGLPRGVPEETDNVKQPLATSTWCAPEKLETEILEGPEANKFAYGPGRIWLGRTPTEAGIPVGWEDNRHMVTIAGSRAGKGTSAIIPALCEYRGSVLVVDPKGENAFETAHRRGYGASNVEGMNQDVRILCPFKVRHKLPEDYLATYNPLDLITIDNDEAVEDAGLIADALVVSTSARDAHWDDSAKALLEALILHVASWPDFADDERNLLMVRRLLMRGDEREAERLRAPKVDFGGDADTSPSKRVDPFDCLFRCMMANVVFDGVIQDIAAGFAALGEREYSSILSTARRNTKFLDSHHMAKVLGSSTEGFSLDELKTQPAGVSIYLVLPARRMATHSRWIRLLLNLTVSRMEAVNADNVTGYPVLALLDELPVLGHLQCIETAMGFMAGFGLRLWAFLQDINQLKRHYPESWETFLGNSGMIQCFGNTDLTTLEYISKKLGEAEVIRQTHNHSTTTSESWSDLSPAERLEKSEGKNFISRAMKDLTFDDSTRRPSGGETTTDSDTDSIMRTPLLTPDEIARYFSRKSGLQIILTDEPSPIFLRRTPYYEDSHFAGKYSSYAAGAIVRQSS